MSRVDEVLALIDDNPGPAFREMNHTMLSAFIHYEYSTNRWAMVVNPDSDQVDGWMSWYCLDIPSLNRIFQSSLLDCFQRDIPLHSGREVYICNSVVRSGAPKGTFRTLWNSVVRANPKATSFSAHLNNRKKTRWFFKRVNGSKPL